MGAEKIRWFLFFSKKDRVLALPTWAAPRILIVSRSPRQRWRDSSAFYPAFRFRAKLAKLAVRISTTFFPKLFWRQRSKNASGTKHGLATFLNKNFPSFKQSAIAYSLFPDYFISTGVLSADEYVDCEEQRGWLADLIHSWFPQANRAVLMAGAASDPKQKLVAKLVDQRGKMVGFVKFGEKPLARQRIETEAEILQALPQGCGPGFQGLKKAEEYACFAMSAVEGKMLPARLPASVDSCQLMVVKEYLNQLRVADELFEIDAHPAIVHLREHLSDAVKTKPDQLSNINEQLDNLLEPLRRQCWPLVIQHGDFTPWNVLRVREEKVVGCQMEVEGETSTTDNVSTNHPQSRLCAIDWEEGTTEGFPHFDFIYYILQTAYFMHHWSPAQAFAYAQEVLSSQLSAAGSSSTTSNQNTATARAAALIRLAALDAWLAGERGGLTGNPLQQFRLSIINLSATGGSAGCRKT
jgi:hypothetical protein